MGGFIGDPEGTKNFVEAKVQAWVASVDKLSFAAESQPQAAYHMLLSQNLCILSGPICKVLPNCDASFAPLHDIINKRFWPSVFGGQISTAEQHLFSLPTRFGGMGIFDPVELAKAAYTTSRASTNMLVNSIKNNADFVVSSHCAEWSN